MLLDVVQSAPGRPLELLGSIANSYQKKLVFEVLQGPRRVEIGPQRPLGPILECLGLMDASRNALGGLFERSWTAPGPKKTLSSGFWPAQEEFEERFQPSWGPKGSQKGAQNGSKTGPKRIQAENDEITKLEGRLMKFLDFSGPKVSL